MGSFMAYKDVETLIDGLALLPADYRLHLLSRISDARRAELSARSADTSRLIFHNGVTDEQYAQLLSDNAILVSASRDEGYGLPVAEALAMDVPAVITDMPIFREVAGEGAEYFAPGDARAMADAVEKLADPAERERIVEAGRDHISRFNWDRSARILVDAAESLLAGR
jgi:glycosyltransferase involved in cell wall biosynthesis